MTKNENYLDMELISYAESDNYPFHMPGHKRQQMLWQRDEKGDGRKIIDDIFYQVSQLDITEIDGFDNLHHPEGILREAGERMAKLFGADKSFFLVNGSTAGLLAAISATVKKDGKILIARNCHKAVYNAIYLRGLSVEYVYPMKTPWGIQGSIDPEDIRKKLEGDSTIQAVLITSPTYDGVVSDIETIAQIVHAHHIPLIVDEAHGAHFGFSAGFPKKALNYGADVVIESMHKTLPAFTQSAALHLQGDLVDVAQIQRFLSIYQSSSPSYLLMAGLDRCVRILEQEGHRLFAAYEKRLARFYQDTKGLQHLQVLSLNCIETSACMNDNRMATATGVAFDDRNVMWDKDASKILIFCTQCQQKDGTLLTGHGLAQILREAHGLEMEMTSAHYVTALTSLMDTEGGFERLAAALLAIDEGLSVDEGTFKSHDKNVEKLDSDSTWEQSLSVLYAPKEKRMEITEAYEMTGETVLWSEAAGKVSTEFAYLYPPGIPFLTPGEMIPESIVSIVERLQAEGFAIQGLSDLSGQQIRVCQRDE